MSASGGRGDYRLAAAILLIAVIAAWALRTDSTKHDQQVSHTHPPTAPPIAAIDDYAADPIKIRIPDLELDADMDPLEVGQNQTLNPPTSYDRTGWWRDGPEPGEKGPAVVAGHVDSYKGPAVFYRLRDLTPGGEILIDRADGTTVVFQIDRVEQHSKSNFPTEAVYKQTPDSQLRLVTCGGEFDESAGSYRDNLIIYLHRI